MMDTHESTWMPMDEVNAFTRQARNGTTVIFEVVDPVDGERLQDTFSLQGLGQGLAGLSSAN